MLGTTIVSEADESILVPSREGKVGIPIECRERAF